MPALQPWNWNRFISVILLLRPVKFCSEIVTMFLFYLNAYNSMKCSLLATKTSVCSLNPSNALSGMTSKLDMLMSKC